MLFHVYTIVLAIAALGILLFAITAFFRDAEVAMMIFTFGGLFWLFATFPALMMISDTAGNIATIKTQSNIIKIQRELVTSLTDRLNSFNFPRPALVNQDTPVASLVEALTQAEKDLAHARKRCGWAIRDLTQTEVGAWSGKLAYLGSYDKTMCE